jgi:hypothetical protein
MVLTNVSQFRTGVILISVGAWADQSILNRIFSRARVPIYGVSIAGLRSPIVTTARGVAINPSSAGRGSDALKNLSERSGGFAITDTNDPLGAVARILSEHNSYYVLGYRPLYPASDGQSRRVEVRVKRDGTETLASTRSVGGRTAETPVRTTSSLTRALQDIVPDADLPLRVNVAPFAAILSRDRDRNSAMVLTTLYVAQPQPSGTATTVDSVDVEARVFDPEGRKQVALTRQTARVAAQPSRAGAVQYELLSRLDLWPGRYNLRFAIRVGTSGSTASVYTDVIVPDFWRDQLTMSGVIMQRVPALPVGPAGLFDSLLPIVPTTERDFDRRDRVSSFFRVYQGGTSHSNDVGLSTRIINDNDATVFENSEKLTAERFDSIRRSVDHQFELPISTLLPGEYLLRFDTTLAHSVAARTVRFRVN